MIGRPSYRHEMFWAYSFPVMLFIVLPCVVLLLIAPMNTAALAGALGLLATLAIPVYLVGYALAPWAGGRVRSSKGPAFSMAIAAALSSAFSAAGITAITGGPTLSPGTAIFVAFFAVPASLLGALLFIGACERSQMTLSGRG